MEHTATNLRAHFMAHAPITASDALAFWDHKATHIPRAAKERAAFMASWALLNREYADAMIEAFGTEAEGKS